MFLQRVDAVHEIIPATNHATVTRTSSTVRVAVGWLRKIIARQQPTFEFIEGRCVRACVLCECAGQLFVRVCACVRVCMRVLLVS